MLIPQQKLLLLRKFLGFPGGMLKESDDLMAKVSDAATLKKWWPLFGMHGLVDIS